MPEWPRVGLSILVRKTLDWLKTAYNPSPNPCAIHRTETISLVWAKRGFVENGEQPSPLATICRPWSYVDVWVHIWIMKRPYYAETPLYLLNAWRDCLGEAQTGVEIVNLGWA